MPWTKKQVEVAQAVKHGWKPKGKAKGFTKKFADEVVEEDAHMERRRKKAEQMLGKGAKPSGW